jgi:hypothetical protein
MASIVFRTILVRVAANQSEHVAQSSAASAAMIGIDPKYPGKCNRTRNRMIIDVIRRLHK